MANLHDLMAHYHNQVASYNEGTAHNPTLSQPCIPTLSQPCEGCGGCEGAGSSYIITGCLVMVMSHVLMVSSHEVMEISHVLMLISHVCCLHNMLMRFHYKLE